MKKCLSLLLVIALLASATVVMAEEIPEELIFSDGQIFSEGEMIPEDQISPEDEIFSEDEMSLEDQMIEDSAPKVVPDVPYGSDMTTAISLIKADFEDGMVVFNEISDPETRTLSNGKDYQEITMIGDSKYEEYHINAKYYFTNDGKAIAGIVDFTLTGDIDGLSIRNFLIEAYGEPGTLVLEDLGDLAELFGESVLENGQDLWQYTYTPKILQIVQGENKTNNAVAAFITLRIVDDHVYLIQFLNPDYLQKMEKLVLALNVKGYDKLTEDEQQAVSLYADFLEAQKQEQLKQYIDFLLKQN